MENGEWRMENGEWRMENFLLKQKIPSTRLNASISNSRHQAKEISFIHYIYCYNKNKINQKASTVK